jgi:transcription antitermination factor NusG
MSIEEDPEPFWYLLNCVAGLEIDLLRQCRAITEDMPDAVKFVVPTERKTRSHGPKKIVTETKVRYQGYVFGKLRLCPEVYEAIQELDLCRSWMGTVNHKGYKKLPPAPIALNELEVENFGLEAEESVEDDDLNTSSGGIIVDAAEEDVKAQKRAKIDRDALKVYLGLAVDDMVKVTAKGKFLNEDGIVRRLKEGQIFVRFYTYGTMFEEWLDPAAVRVLTNMEILQGLSGPTQPVTQRDLEDDPTSGSDSRGRKDRRAPGGPGGDRNRRQDRTARNFQPGGFADGNEQRRNDKNWNWYQDQQQQQQRPNDYRDDSHGYQAGTRPAQRREMPRREASRDRGGDWAVGNVDSQWGRNNNSNNPRQQQPQRPGRENQRDTRRDKRQADRGDSDWNAFVTPANKRKESSGSSSSSGDDDDFFASLMNDLSTDLGGGTDQKKTSPAPASSSSSSSDDDAFFSSLMSELSEEDKSPPKQVPAKKRTAPLPATQSTSKDDDFFASLEAELGTVDSDGSLATSQLNDADGLFAKLEAELTPVKTTLPLTATKANDDDFTAKLDAELAPPALEKEEFFGSMAAPRRVVGAARPVDPTPRTADVAPTTASSSTQSQGSNSGSDFSQQTVPALKEMLRARGLKVSGKKADLIDRLTQ